MAKTLIDFRAEKGLYLKDIAEKTGIPEDELRAVEQSGTVPPHIADILINDYYLPDTYFSEIVISSKVQPKSPMKYFLGVSFVYSILSGIVVAIPMYIGMMITLIVSLATHGNINFSVTGSPIFTIFNNVWISAVSLISCIIFANFILKRTNFTGDIKKYQFLHYAVPSGVVAGFSMVSAYMAEYAFLSNDDMVATLVIEVIGLIFSLATTLISVYISAILLKTAIEEDREKKFKTLKILAIVVTISSTIAYLLTILSYSIFDYDYSNYFVLIRRIFVYGLYIAVAWAVALTKTDDEKKNKIVFTVLPLISILHSVVFTIIGEFI